MTDLSYIIESADVRIPNACPELPDMEFEPVTAVNTAVCKACRYRVRLEKSHERYENKKRMKYRKPEVLTYERINSVCRQAQIEGTSYGKIMSKKRSVLKC